MYIQNLLFDKYENWRDQKNSVADLVTLTDIGNHFHRQMEIMVVTKGTVCVTVNGVTKTLVAGQFSIADNYDVHSYALGENVAGNALIIPKNYLSDYIALTKKP
ncbi:MAG: cupin domain-containing protein [Clostridiales bacterium]|jgi:hypothetical protein|nr:cupin domain-containing protein [Clostridiales bacterium]